MVNRIYSNAFLIVGFLVFVLSANAQEALCTKGLTYGELVSLNQITSEAALIKAIEAECFEFNEEDNIGLIKVYERRYEKQDNESTTRYNELILIKYGKLYRYSCSEFAQCNKLLAQIDDNTIFYYESPDKEKAHLYILKGLAHKFEMINIPNTKIGYAYGFLYMPVTPLDLSRIKTAKSEDTFPKSNLERAKLEYRYAKISSYGSPTSIHINAGDRVWMEAGGEITLGSWAGNGGPAGIDGFTSYNEVEGFRHGCLLYRIGTGKWNAVGTEVQFTATSSGKIEFTVNDNDVSNNSGAFWANLKIIRAK